MYTYDFTLENVAKLSGAIRSEPAVTPDLKYLPTQLLPAMILAMIREQPMAANDIFAYLDARGAPFDLESIVGVLDYFDGDEPSLHLWRKNAYGKVHPLFMDSPGEHPFLFPTYGN